MHNMRRLVSCPYLIINHSVWVWQSHAVSEWPSLLNRTDWQKMAQQNFRFGTRDARMRTACTFWQRFDQQLNGIASCYSIRTSPGIYGETSKSLWGKYILIFWTVTVNRKWILTTWSTKTFPMPSARPVSPTASCEAICCCCDHCSLWFHRTCIRKNMGI